MLVLTSLASQYDRCMMIRPENNSFLTYLGPHHCQERFTDIYVFANNIIAKATMLSLV
jgi:hypothetical protein